MAGELKIALESKVSAEIQIDKLRSENILLQEEITTFHINGSKLFTLPLFHLHFYLYKFRQNTRPPIGWRVVAISSISKLNQKRDPDSESKVSQDLSTSDYDRTDFDLLGVIQGSSSD